MATEAQLVEQSEEQYIDPWTVKAGSGGFDYLKLLNQFGTQPITPELINRIETLTKRKVHTLLRRGIFFSQQDLEQFLNHYEQGNPVYVYTGRGPSSESMHLGHLVPFEFTKYLQGALGCIVVIQMSDDEKFYFKGGDLDNYRRLARENAKDIISVGFDPERTYIFSNFEEIANGNPGLHRNNVIMSSYASVNQVRSTFGLNALSLTVDENGVTKPTAESVAIGMMAWPVYQSTPAFSSSFEYIFGSKEAFCLVPMACDQAPYFRLARDFAGFNKNAKPACIHSEFLIGLGGRASKMSSTESVKPIFLTDTEKEASAKISKCMSGGGETRELQEKFGADLTIDVPYQWALVFENDDNVLKSYAERYSSGEILTGHMKEYMKNLVAQKLAQHQAARTLVTDEVVDKFFSKQRHFNLERPPVDESFVPSSDEVYETQGANFDRYFGCLQRREARNNAITASTTTTETSTQTMESEETVTSV